MLLHQSLRHVAGASTSSITLDLLQAKLRVPSAFGVLQNFVLDLDKIDPSGNRDVDPLSISYTVAILAAIKACLRSTMLRYCFDADPLFATIRAWPEIVDV